MSDNSISRQYMAITIPIAQSVVNDRIRIWEATTPDTIDQCDLVFDQKMPSLLRITEGYREFTETEKAVWCSHYRLWQRIWDEKIGAWILEHDVDISNVILPESKYKNEHIITMMDEGLLWCYYVDYVGARFLIDKTKEKPINTQVDGFLEALMLHYESTREISRVERQNIRCFEHLGNTIDHP